MTSASMALEWSDLSREAADTADREWHAEILAEREQRLAAGQERIMDWDEAKRLLRREIHESQDS